MIVLIIFETYRLIFCSIIIIIACTLYIIVKLYLQIPRYIITLHELLAHTPHDHVERKSLQNARQQLEHLSRQMHDEVNTLFNFLYHINNSSSISFTIQ